MLPDKREGYDFIFIRRGGEGTEGTDNTYTKNKCKKNTGGGSDPTGLCKDK